MIRNRFAALVIIFLIYVLAAVTGIVSYNYFSGSDGILSLAHFGIKSSVNYSYPVALFLADVVATVVVFIFSLIFKNASVYDPYWSVQPPVILAVTIAKLSALENGVGVGLLGWLLFAAVMFWALRLTANWIYNFKSFEYQDWRYVMLREQSGKFYGFINFLGIHLFPTIVVYFCVLPAVVAMCEGVSFKPACFIFIALSFTAAVCQGIADIQMHRFRNSGGQGFIREGLWKNSRHPNYACEILMWWGIGLACVVSFGGRVELLLGAAINTLMFLFISVPLADKHQSRKPGFAEYKKTTRIF